MEPIYQWGLRVIHALQGASPLFNLPLTIVTRIGGQTFTLLLLAFIYWSLDRRLGRELTIVILISAYVNVVIKALADQPRPFQLDPSVALVHTASGPGFPSGHTQNATLLWGYLGARVQRLSMWIVSALLIILIPFSRIYLGVHFPTDVLGGYVIGGVMLVLALILLPRLAPRLGGLRLPWQLLVAAAFPVLLALAFSTTDGITTSGTLMGMGVGFALEPRWVGFSPSSKWGRRILGFIVGVAVLAALEYGLGAASASLVPATVVGFVRFGLVGFWGALGAPWTLARLGLVSSHGS